MKLVSLERAKICEESRIKDDEHIEIKDKPKGDSFGATNQQI